MGKRKKKQIIGYNSITDDDKTAMEKRQSKKVERGIKKAGVD